MKVSDQNGGGECVLIKIKSAEKNTQNSNRVFVYLAEFRGVFALPKSF